MADFIRPLRRLVSECNLVFAVSTQREEVPRFYDREIKVRGTRMLLADTRGMFVVILFSSRNCYRLRLYDARREFYLSSEGNLQTERICLRCVRNNRVSKFGGWYLIVDRRKKVCFRVWWLFVANLWNTFGGEMFTKTSFFFIIFVCSIELSSSTRFWISN